MLNHTAMNTKSYGAGASANASFCCAHNTAMRTTFMAIAILDVIILMASILILCAWLVALPLAILAALAILVLVLVLVPADNSHTHPQKQAFVSL